MSQPSAASVRFEALESADLVVDAIYLGGTAKNVTDDPVAKLLPVGNSGGIRFKGSSTNPQLVALITSGEDIDWPDTFNLETGSLTYYGDNKTGGRELHDTPRLGNVLLRNAFDLAHGSRHNVAPFLVFRREGGSGRNYRFLGVAVPGSSGLDFSEDLVAIWRTKAGSRFQNYRATFTVLDTPRASRAWIADILAGHPLSENAPDAWSSWVLGGRARPLLAPRTASARSVAEQTPGTATDRALIAEIHGYFAQQPHEFEHLAAHLAGLALPSTASIDVTRQSRDGGRDAIGKYRVGVGEGSILIDFALEAKCYSPTNTVGVREVSRLISRLRHRQFGVLVTTSVVSAQTYSEIVEDGHPIVVIAAADIVNIIRRADVPTTPSILPWLRKTFPLSGTDPTSVGDSVTNEPVG